MSACESVFFRLCVAVYHAWLVCNFPEILYVSQGMFCPLLKIGDKGPVRFCCEPVDLTVGPISDIEVLKGVSYQRDTS